MSSVHQVPFEQDADTLFWLDLAKRVLAGEISPDEAIEALHAGDGDAQREQVGD